MAFKYEVNFFSNCLSYSSQVFNLLLNCQFMIMEILLVKTMKSPETNCCDTFRHSLFCLICSFRCCLTCNMSIYSHLITGQSSKQLINRHTTGFTLDVPQGLIYPGKSYADS